ncbi:unnamed protein product [Moneuplotes crassus]|uniref:Uncharacterized protein n=1 Tax=Euplotes crassus TaxID=5936 RepID=A0AAD2CY85_EUPCR|nr:unnamed protein product [Moneuplotes crassus]
MDFCFSSSQSSLFSDSASLLQDEASVQNNEEQILTWLRPSDESAQLTSPTLFNQFMNDEHEFDSTIFSKDYYSHNLFGAVPYQESELERQIQKSKPVIENLDLTVKEKSAPINYQRPDISNRKMLRLVKKFFNELFLFHNDKLRNRRLTTVHSSVTLEALRQLVRVYMPDVSAEFMAEFLFNFLNIHSKDSCQLESDAAEQGFRVYQCSYNYRRQEFILLPECEYFRYLIISYINLKNTSLSSLLSLRLDYVWENQFHTSEAKLVKILSKSLYKKGEALVEESLQRTYEECYQTRETRTD